MKFGLLIDFGSPYCNYGDAVQSIAIEYLYGLMNIPETEIVHITKKELASYNGEQLLLPYSYVLYFLVNTQDGSVSLSKKITPVFLGASIEFALLFNSYPLDNFTNPGKKWIEFFKKYSPIGCRDEFTHRFLAKQGISAYLQGCITNILPRRPDGEYKKTLLIDCPSEVLPYIPKDRLANAEVMSNAAHISGSSAEENYRKIKKRYQYYRDCADLVVSSRYHVVTPCNAMGIPSIFVVRPFDKHLEDIRLDTLNPSIQLCLSETFSSINWCPQWQDFGELKSNVTQLAIARIRETYERYTLSEKIHRFYQSRINQYENVKNKGVHYTVRLRKYIQDHYAVPTRGRFYIWGAISLLCNKNRVAIVDLIHDINPDLKFAGWVDTFKTGKLAGKPILKPGSFDLGDNDFILIAAETAVSDALKLFEKIKLNKKQYLVLVNTTIQDADLRNEAVRRSVRF